MLVLAPLRNQLDEPAYDKPDQIVNGQNLADENRNANCAQAALASLVSGYTGLEIYGDELKDLAYGEAFTGGTDPMHDQVIVLRDWHIDIIQESPPTANDGWWMVERIGWYLKQHIGVLGAIPSQWGVQTNADILRNPQLGTHEVAFCDATFNRDGSVATLTAMNPWPVNGNAFYHTQPAAWWAARLVYNRINPVLPPKGAPFVSNVTPSWDNTAQTVTYPAHDGVPEIVLSHMQAIYAKPGTGSTRDGLFPLMAEEALNGAGDGYVIWSDTNMSVAVKSANWAISLMPAAARVLAGLAAVPEVTTLQKQVAALNLQLQAVPAPATVTPESDQEKAEAASWRQLQTLLTTVK